MIKEDRVLFAVLSAMIILLLFAAIFLYGTKESEKEKRVGLQKQVEELTVKGQIFESKLKETEIANARMAASIKFQEEKINMLAMGLEEEKEANGKNLASIQIKEIEAQNLKAKIEEIRAEKEDVMKSLEKLNEEYLNMKFHLENLIKTKEELETRAKELSEKEGVSLGTVIVKQARN
jgi:mannitol-specific phosphotransferase system IIBC component